MMVDADIPRLVPPVNDGDHTLGPDDAPVTSSSTATTSARSAAPRIRT